MIKDYFVNSENKQKTDPSKKQFQKKAPSEGLSPMDPPDEYAPPGNIEQIPYEQLHPILQEFYDDHDKIIEAIKVFEETLLFIQKNGISSETSKKLGNFFYFFDHEFIAHDQREEKVLFPLLAERLIENGEHSQSSEPTTAIDRMEEDHLKAIQLAGIIFNLFGLCVRLPDERSRLLVLDTALEQGKTLVELLRLHIFRENNIVFPLAHQYIDKSEFDQMKGKGVPCVKN